MAQSNAVNTNQAQIFSGLTKGIVRAGSPERQAERSAARLRKEELDQQLEQTLATRPTKADLGNLADAQTAQIEAAETQAKMTNRALIKQSTFTSFDRYNNDNFDVRHLNVMFKDLASTSEGQNLFGDITRVDEITEADRKLLDSQGLPSDLIINDPAMKGTYVKTTSADGSQAIRSVDRLKAATGYTDYADQEELNRQVTVKKLEQIALTGGGQTEAERFGYTQAISQGFTPGTPEFAAAVATGLSKFQTLRRSRGRAPSTEDERRANRRALLDGFEVGTPEYEKAYLGYLDEFTQSTGVGSVNEREADRQVEAAIDGGDTRDRETIFNEKFDEITARRARTKGQKEREEAVRAQDNLDELAGGNFFDSDLDMTDPRIRARIEPNIASIEAGFDAKLSNAELKTLERINELTLLGDASSELTADQTGIIDRVFRNVRKYISDNVEGVQQEAAYAAYRNVVRHAMFGSVLTPGETASFKEQFGALTQQVGPILAQLKSSLGQVKSNYETLLATNNPYVMQYRTGKTASEIEDVISAIDERLELIDGFKSESVIQPQPQVRSAPVTISSDNRAKLDAIYNSSANGLGATQ